MERTKRIDWIDAVRCIAIYHVVFIHGLDKFWPALLNYWVTPPSSYLPILFNAKVAVVIFCVLLGFFASKKRELTLSGVFSYTVWRYIQFALFILLTGVIYVVGAYGVTWLFHNPDEYAYRVICDGVEYNVIYVLRDAFLLENNYNPTLWSMQQFFIASLQCYLLGCLSSRVKPLTVAVVTAVIIALTMVYGGEYMSWTAFCMMGVLLRLYADNVHLDLSQKRGVKLLLILLCVVLFKLPESTAAYLLYSVAAVILMIVLLNCPAAQSFLSGAPLPRLGKLSFGVFVAHSPIHSLLASSLCPLLLTVLPLPLTALLMIALSMGLSTLYAHLPDAVYRRLRF